ncbi:MULTISPECIES: DUF202 domain-containing protein [unclassified Roseovarius]|uniref:DUF202 domain-containing protein n=1 Tax=unclassified Roseovarius TaxID=2614913 RepID=UPI00273E4C01|nr:MULTISPECIES: DUF202 domain-containing protein [unclassified Roseovarius]
MADSENDGKKTQHESSGSKAEMRTAWAEDRTIMANERTFSSWMGFGLGAVGVAIGLKAVFGDFDPTWAAKLVATMFLAIAIVIYWAARRQACKTLRRLSDNDAEAMPTKSFTLLATLLSLATAATGAVLWAL